MIFGHARPAIFRPLSKVLPWLCSPREHGVGGHLDADVRKGLLMLSTIGLDSMVILVIAAPSNRSPLEGC